jgi:hypothetical protein
MLKIIILTCLLLLLPFNAFADVPDLAVDKAKSYLYVRETTNRNDSKEIDLFLGHVGLPKGSPYCMAFVSYSYCLAAKEYNKKSPVPKYGAVNQFYYYAEKNPLRYHILKTNRLLIGIEKGNRGDILIFKKGVSQAKYDVFKGHTGLVIRQINNRSFETIEGNTSGSNTGDQRGEGNVGGKQHDGVYVKIRETSLGRNFPLIGLVRCK